MKPIAYKSPALYFFFVQGALENELIRVQSSLQSELTTKKQTDSQKMELEGLHPILPNSLFASLDYSIE